MGNAERFELAKQKETGNEVKTFEQELAEQVDIKIFYGDYKDAPNPVFAVQFQSKLTSDQPTKLILESELLINTKEKQMELLKHCGLDINQYHHLLTHINELKKKKCITEVTNIYAIMHPCAENEDGVALYNMVYDTLRSQIHRYPLLSAGSFQPEDPGLILDTKAYSGQNVIALTTKTLYNLLNWEQISKNEYRLKILCEAWDDLGYLIKPSEERYNKWIKLGGQRFYIIKIRNLSKLLLQKGGSKSE